MEEIEDQAVHTESSGTLTKTPMSAKSRLLKDLSFLTSTSHYSNSASHENENNDIDDNVFGDGTDATLSSSLARNRESLGLDQYEVDVGSKSLIRSSLQQGKLLGRKDSKVIFRIDIVC